MLVLRKRGVGLHDLADRESTGQFNGPEIRYSIHDSETGYAILLEKWNGRVFREEGRYEKCGGLALRGIRV